MNATHLSAEQIAAQLEHRLDGHERDATLRHLESCAECRHELAEASRLIDAVPVARRRFVIPAITLIAAAAAFAVVARGALDAGRAPSDERTQRVAQPDLVPPIVVIKPADDAVETSRSVAFLWEADGPDAMYRVTLQDDAGRVLWTWTTRDTTAAVPDSVKLPEAQAYYWSVDALRPDGRSTTSKAHRFRR